jgi:uncharacterized protein involved in exopolysaccharide biosynthesis
MSDIIMIVSSELVRRRARRLPPAIALRMEEEWLSELNSITGGPAKLAFAVALLLTRRQAFVAPGEDAVSTVYDRPSLGSRKSLLVLSTLVFAIAAYGASFLQPVKYESEVLLVSKERDDHILRRARSDRLFTSVAAELPQRENLVEDLRSNTTVLPLHDPSESGTSFVVKYRGNDPAMAQNVTNRLASQIIEMDLAQRYDHLSQEKAYLRDQLEELAARVEKKGDELRFVRNAHPASREMLALDHELLVSSYKALFAKHQDAQMATALQHGRFQTLDGAQTGRPVGPNRVAFAGIGALVGLILAVVAVVGRGRRQPPAITVSA